MCDGTFVLLENIHGEPRRQARHALGQASARVTGPQPPGALTSSMLFFVLPNPWNRLPSADLAAYWHVGVCRFRVVLRWIRGHFGYFMARVSEASAQAMLLFAFAANTLLQKCIFYYHPARRLLVTFAVHAAVLSFLHLFFFVTSPFCRDDFCHATVLAW